MNKQVFSLSGNTPEIVIKTRNDLVLEGVETNEISLESYTPHSFEVRRQGDRFQIEFIHEGFLWVPSRAKIMVERVAGDASVQGLSGELVLHKIGGDLTLYQVDGAVVDQVGGDCRVELVKGNLVFHKVGGDFKAREIGGSTLVEHVGGDFWLQGGGFPATAHAGGDIRTSFTAIQEGYADLNAGGDVLVNLPQNAAFNLKATCNSEDIDLEIGAQPLKIEQRYYEAKFGTSKATLMVKAGGDVKLSDQAWQPEIMDDFQQRLDSQLSELQEKLSSKLNEVNHIVNDSTRRAERRVQEAFKHLDRKTQAWGQYGSVHSRNSQPVNVNLAHDEVQGKASEPVSSDERLMILKMVEAKKITPEQAQKLFDALDGK